MDIWNYILLFTTTLIGGGIALLIPKSNTYYLKLALSFSGSFILGMTILHLMPTVFQDNSTRAGYWIIGGFFLQLLLENLSKGIEHGHLHAHEQSPTNLAYTVMLGLSLHSFMEGLPLDGYESLHHHTHGHDHDHDHNHGHLLYSIILHKLPAAFALMSLFLLSGFSKLLSIILLVIFAAMSPLGAFLASLINLSVESISNLLALVIGSFLHISTTILFEADNSRQHKISYLKLLVIAIGIGFALLSVE